MDRKYIIEILLFNHFYNFVRDMQKQFYFYINQSISNKNKYLNISTYNKHFF